MFWVIWVILVLARLLILDLCRLRDRGYMCIYIYESLYVCVDLDY